MKINGNDIGIAFFDGIFGLQYKVKILNVFKIGILLLSLQRAGSRMVPLLSSCYWII